jgi:hypothetical protein
VTEPWVEINQLFYLEISITLSRYRKHHLENLNNTVSICIHPTKKTLASVLERHGTFEKVKCKDHMRRIRHTPTITFYTLSSLSLM